MATRLTLNIDEKVIKKAKNAAKKRKISVSRLFAEYIITLEPPAKNKKQLPPVTPLVEWLSSGQDLPAKPAKKDYVNHLLKKHGRKV